MAKTSTFLLYLTASCGTFFVLKTVSPPEVLWARLNNGKQFTHPCLGVLFILPLSGKRPVCLTRGLWVKPVPSLESPAWRSQICDNFESGVSLKIPNSRSRFSVGRRDSNAEKYTYLFKLTNIFFFTIGLQTELDFRSLLFIPTLPWRQNLFHTCTLKETSSSSFFKSNTNATCANCPTSFLSFHYLFLMALKQKKTELNGWEVSFGDRLPEFTP